MAFPKYIGWVKANTDSGWTSVALGSRSAVETKAREIINSPLWRDLNPDGGQVRITTDGRQAFVTSYVID